MIVTEYNHKMFDNLGSMDLFSDVGMVTLFFCLLWQHGVIYCINSIFCSLICFYCVGDHISVSGPEGTFSLRPLRDVTHLYLLAAGTGFTPMARLIRLAIQEMDNIR